MQFAVEIHHSPWLHVGQKIVQLKKLMLYMKLQSIYISKHTGSSIKSQSAHGQNGAQTLHPWELTQEHTHAAQHKNRSHTRAQL
jgi:hypothetical protein